MKTPKSFVSILAEANTEYAKVFDSALEKWKVSDPSELSDDEKKKFFDFVDSQYESDAEEKGVSESTCVDCQGCGNCSDLYTQQFSQHPEEDLTEAKRARFYTKTFPSRHFEYYDWRESASSFYVEREDVYSPVVNDVPEECSDEPVPDYRDELILGSSTLPRELDEADDEEEKLKESCCPYTSPEPDSAVFASLSGDKPAKRIDVIKDINRTSPDNAQSTYRFWFQYANGQSTFIPHPHQSGVVNLTELEDLASTFLPQDQESAKSAIQHMLAKELALNPARTGAMTSRIAESNYQIHHPTYSSAIQAAIKMARAKGFEVADDEVFQQVSIGPARPRPGKTNSLTLQLTKNGVPVKKYLHIQVYGMEHGTYELNTYIW
jgi:hypothetical protein